MSLNAPSSSLVFAVTVRPLNIQRPIKEGTTQKVMGGCADGNTWSSSKQPIVLYHYQLIAVCPYRPYILLLLWAPHYFNGGRWYQKRLMAPPGLHKPIKPESRACMVKTSVGSSRDSDRHVNVHKFASLVKQLLGWPEFSMLILNLG